jgi:hypothetical protein
VIDRKKLVFVMFGMLMCMAAVLEAAIIETTCNQQARDFGWCSSDQDGQPITVFSFSVTGPPDAQCPHEKTNEVDCQAARVLKALSPSWTASVICSQPLVDAGVCHRTYLGRKIGNPTSRRQFADREHRLAIWNIVSQDWRKDAEGLIGPPPPLLMDGKEPP